MKKHRIKKVSLLLAALLLLFALPVPAMAEKGQGVSAKAATPSSLQKENRAVKEEAETKAPAAAAPPKEGPKQKAEDITGTWTIDGVTSYCFREDGTGTLLLPEHQYPFAFTLEGDKLTLKFGSSKIGKAVFTAAREGDTLTLVREEEAGKTEFTLELVKDGVQGGSSSNTAKGEYRLSK